MFPMTIAVRVRPHARANEVRQLDDQSYEVSVTVPPVDGKANERVIELLEEEIERKQTISASLARSTTNRQKIAVSRAALAREAITHYEVLERFGNPPVASLVRCRLETGRTHQIRVHLAHIGHPLLGDPTYGAGFRSAAARLSAAAREALKALNRQALHAAILGFEHPASRQALATAAPTTRAVRA